MNLSNKSSGSSIFFFWILVWGNEEYSILNDNIDNLMSFGKSDKHTTYLFATCNTFRYIVASRDMKNLQEYFFSNENFPDVLNIPFNQNIDSAWFGLQKFAFKTIVSECEDHQQKLNHWNNLIDNFVIA